jgi:hypothetical protein
MLKRTLFTALAAAVTLAFAASAQAAYLSLGTTNTSNATTALSGNSAGAELLVKNSNGSSASAFGVYGLLTPTSPTVNATAVRGQNSATNARGYGVYGSQAGSGTGVRGFASSGKGVWGSSTSGTGVYGQHTSTSGAAPGVEGLTSSTSGSAAGVYGASSSSGRGVAGFSDSWQGVYGHSNSNAGVVGESTDFDGVYGVSHSAGAAVSGHNNGGGYAFWGETNGPNPAIFATNPFATAVHGDGYVGVVGTGSNFGVDGASDAGYAIYGASSSGYAGYFVGKVSISGGCTGCTGPSALQIDDPLDPAHKYLNHASVVSSQQLDVYSGNVRTNGKGFATVHMPRWFQALNRSFRYQLTPLGRRGWDARAGVWTRIRNNRFTIRTDKPRVEISWQVTAVRHDPLAEARPTRVIVAKPRADQGKYVNPQLYGKPRSDGIGYRKPPRLARTAALKK